MSNAERFDSAFKEVERLVDPAHQLAATRRFLTAADVDAIQALTREGSAVVVDLGSGSGTTALAVLGVNPDATIVSFDNDRANRDWAEKNVQVHYPEANVTWIVGEAAEPAARQAWDLVKRLAVDLLLHDASHRYEDVLADIKAWHPHLEPGTAVWVHDFGPPPLDWGANDDSPEVRAAIEELVLGGFLVETKGPVGLGWIGEIS